MQAGEFQAAGFREIQNALHEGEPCSVAQFYGLKTHFRNFLQKNASIRLPMRIPAG
jgi:hypothetical protein